MNKQSRIVVRAHTEIEMLREKQKRRRKEKEPPKWPLAALVFDCETRTDEAQSLTFGIYRICWSDDSGNYTRVGEEGFFYDPREIKSRELSILKKFAKQNRAETTQGGCEEILVRTREDFLREVFLPMGLSGAMIVGFNLPFDVSRIAADARKARRLNDDWSFVLLDRPFCPRIVVTRKDGKMAFFRFSGVHINPKSKKKKRLIRVPRGRFLDVRTFAWALRNISFSLEGLCEKLKIPGKLDHTPTGRVTHTEISYARQDVRATIGALNALRTEFDRYPIDLQPNHAYSPASITKAYFKRMGVTEPSKKYRLSTQVQGIAAQSFYGGRAECRIRRTPVPVVHTDFKSEYPTAITLMGLWQLVIAKSLRINDATAQVRKLLDTISLAKMFDPALWKELNCFALLQPDGDILPVRTAYDADSDDNNVGVNILTSIKPPWFALPDLVASTLLTGKPPKILSAIRVVARGQQVGLMPTTLGDTTFDPRTGDFFKMLIETRERIKLDERLNKSDRDALGYFLKILANAGYGIFIETTPKHVAGRKKLRVFSGESVFETTSSVVEDKGPWYCPPLASLITSGGRLFLAMLESVVRELGGTYLFADTDSLAVVATEKGGLVPCVGGSHRLPDGRQAVKALSWLQVQKIVDRFNQLNPYDRDAVPFILKIEDVNFENGLQREIEGYAISAKRYTFFVRASDGVTVVTPSEHGFGHIVVPDSEFDEKQGARKWIIETWRFLVQAALGMKCPKPRFFSLPAMMKFAITTPEVLRVLQNRQLKNLLVYGDRVKPFNFILSPMINRQVLGQALKRNKVMLLGFPTFVDPEHFTLIAPYTGDTSQWYKMRWINVHDGRWFYLAPLARKRSFEASPYTLGDVIELYHIHPEYKSLGPDGSVCGWSTSGLLLRTNVVAEGFDYIGKETDRKWEQDHDISMLFPILPVYRQDETAQLVKGSSIENRSRALSIRAMARRTGLSTRTVRAYRKGKRLRKVTVSKLQMALREYDSERLSEHEDLESKAS